METEIIRNALLVGAGSFIGGGARYIISEIFKSVSTGFPWGTLTVNLSGCLLIGIVCGLMGSAASGNSFAMFCAVGICGGFTTFSTFSKEVLMMLQCGNYCGVAFYVALSVFVGVALTAAGYVLAGRLVQ